MSDAKSNRPTPPDDMADEALIEWQRVCAELEAAGKLEKIDRAILTVYCEVWATHRKATRGVALHGAIVKFPNGIAGASPFYRVQRETATLLRGYLLDLGLTPTARASKAAATADTDELEI